MAAPAGFFDMPRELRDMVYECYTFIDGGYVFNPDSGKLKSAATPRKHPYALQRTCRLIAEEMRGLALAHNTITFSTIRTMRESAMRFDTLMTHFEKYERAELTRLVVHGDSSVIDTAREFVARRFPDFLPILEEMRTLPEEMRAKPETFASEMAGSTGMAPSLQREFIRCTLQHLSAGAPPDPRVLPLSLKPWVIPSHDELDHMTKMIGPVTGQPESRYSREFDTLFTQDIFKYSFSAAAAAIHFFNSYPTICPHMRRVILDEDREAVAFPETHVKGLHPFCVENPHLRIERRINFWTNLVLTSERKNLRNAGWNWSFDGVTWRMMSVSNITFDRNTLSLSRTLAGWLLEAQLVHPNIETLIDGDPAPEKCSLIFRRTMVRDAIWQTAMERCYARQLRPALPLSWYRPCQLEGGYVCEGYPQLIQNIIDGSSSVRCNFSVFKYDDATVEYVISKQSGWTTGRFDVDNWTWHFQRRNPARYKTVSPLPGWRTLLEQDMLPSADYAIVPHGDYNSDLWDDLYSDDEDQDEDDIFGPLS